MTGDAMRLGEPLQQGFFLTTAVDYERAAGVKAASRRRVQGAGDIPLQHDAMTALRSVGSTILPSFFQ